MQIESYRVGFTTLEEVFLRFAADHTGNAVTSPKEDNSMIKTEDGEQFMVIQDYDNTMVFHTKDRVRMIYLANSTVRIDKQR